LGATWAFTFGIFLGVSYLLTLWSVAVITETTRSRILGETLSTALALLMIAAPLLLIVTARIKMLTKIAIGLPRERIARAQRRRPQRGFISFGGFAAWPPGHGHGGELARQVLPAVQAAALSTGCPVIVAARTPALAATYRRWAADQGWQLLPAGSGWQILLAEPSSER